MTQQSFDLPATAKDLQIDQPIGLDRIDSKYRSGAFLIAGGKRANEKGFSAGQFQRCEATIILIALDFSKPRKIGRVEGIENNRLRIT